MVDDDSKVNESKLASLLNYLEVNPDAPRFVIIDLEQEFSCGNGLSYETKRFMDEVSAFEDDTMGSDAIRLLEEITQQSYESLKKYITKKEVD